jgi:hypothetical protein
MGGGVPPVRNRWFAAAAAVVLVIVIALIVSGGGSRAPLRATLTPSAGRAVPAGFLGLSLEYSAIEAYVGDDPADVNPVFEQLVRNLTPGQRPVLRIGGDSTDWTWWPVPGIKRPPGVTYTLTPLWLRVTHALTAALHPHLLLGIDLEADDPEIADVEASELLGGLGAGAVEAFEPGNEPELYRKFPWYRTAGGRLVMGRPMSYGFAAYQRDFAQISSGLPPLPLAGPTLGGPGWMPYIPGYLRALPRVRIVTVHEYPLQLCFVHTYSPHYATVGNLLDAASSTGLADSFRAVVGYARARRLPVRIDELNTVSCGADPKVSQSFASALWALDTLFEMLRVGVAGVNIHTFPGAGYDLLRFDQVHGRWHGTVSPEYYGLLMFARAAPPGARLVAHRQLGTVKLWETRAHNGTLRVVLINKSQTQQQAVQLRLPGVAAGGTLERLLAPSAGATGAVSLAGRRFAPGTTTGRLAGRSTATTVAPVHGRYRVRLPAASAALLTVPARG